MASEDFKKKRKIRKPRMLPDVSDERRHIMASVKQKHTAPEVAVRSILHKLGYRFTVNGNWNRTLPGKPDVVLPRRRTAIFVNGCFWHGHEECKKYKKTKTRTEFWENKIRQNKKRDALALQELENIGWNTLVVWECEVSSKKRVEVFIERIKLLLPKWNSQ